MTNLKWLIYDIKYWIKDALSDVLWWLMGVWEWVFPEKETEKELLSISASDWDELRNIAQEEAYYNQFSDRDWMW